MSIVHNDTEFDDPKFSYCSGNCGQGTNCDCELGNPYAGDWLDTHPLLCAVVAVAAVAAAAIASAYFPLGWFQ